MNARAYGYHGHRWRMYCRYTGCPMAGDVRGTRMSFTAWMMHKTREYCAKRRISERELVERFEGDFDTWLEQHAPAERGG